MGGIKKAFKKVTKVLSPGTSAILGGGSIKDNFKKNLHSMDLGHQVVKQMGLPDPVGDAVYGDIRTLSPAEQVAKQQADLVKAQQEAAALALEEQKKSNIQATQLAEQAALARANQQALANQGTNSDVTRFEFGDGGGAPEDAYSDRRRKRRSTGANLSSQLGVV